MTLSERCLTAADGALLPRRTVRAPADRAQDTPTSTVANPSHGTRPDLTPGNRPVRALPVTRFARRSNAPRPVPHGSVPAAGCPAPLTTPKDGPAA